MQPTLPVRTQPDQVRLGLTASEEPLLRLLRPEDWGFRQHCFWRFWRLSARSLPPRVAAKTTALAELAFLSASDSSRGCASASGFLVRADHAGLVPAGSGHSARCSRIIVSATLIGNGWIAERLLSRRNAIRIGIISA